MPKQVVVTDPCEPISVAEYVRMSTDHQQYSIANQSALIHTYAAENGMQIVQTYADPGRSGLTMKDRPGLSRLLADIVAGDVRFSVVLVYDVSRWGRFQDADESAHYEFLCRRSGIQVIYCAEQFASDGTPFSGVLKALKRAMAGEYSRELSVKVAAGKARIGAMGYRIGGIAGYGLRRQVLEDGSRPGMLLRTLQRKSIQTDRITLVPGPAEEIQLIRRIYREYIYLRKSERQISAVLNSEGLTCFGRPWSRNLVRTILGNEKYVGNNIVGHFSQRLRTPQITHPPEKWIRCNGAFEAIVPQHVFDAAARVRRFNEKTYLSCDEILHALAVVLKQKGKLTTAIINKAPELPSANTVYLRFGTLGQVYELVGYKLAARHQFHSVNRELRSVAAEARKELLQELHSVGLTCSQENGLISFLDCFSVEVIACRFQEPKPYKRGWRICYERSLGGAMLIALRMKPGNAQVRDVLMVPRSALSQLPLFIRAEDDVLLMSYRFRTLRHAARALAARARAGDANVLATT